MQCTLCQSDRVRLVKKSNIPERLSPKNFQITDSAYGVTGDIFTCQECGFMQCLTMADVLPFYEGLEDAGYEDTREERSLQERNVIERVKDFMTGGRLLDIGAGSGILVEEAVRAGFAAEGVEPSRWLQEKAGERGLPVRLGTFPHRDIVGTFDVITIIDVIEHVPDPVGLLRDAERQLARDGIMVVVTPDAGSLAARLLKWKWWHFRIAHIGYFDKKTLALAAEKAGLGIVHAYRPTWYHQADYLFERVMKYFPKFLRLPAPVFLKRVVIPLNLRDSIAVVLKRLPAREERGA